MKSRASSSFSVTSPRGNVTKPSAARRKRSEFEFGVDLAPAEIDAGQISQVIANLVVNADQAMPNGGTLNVSCDNFCYDVNDATIPDLAPGDYVRVRIRDEGVGIPE